MPISCECIPISKTTRRYLTTSCSSPAASKPRTIRQLQLETSYFCVEESLLEISGEEQMQALWLRMPSCGWMTLKLGENSAPPHPHRSHSFRLHAVSGTLQLENSRGLMDTFNTPGSQYCTTQRHGAMAYSGPHLPNSELGPGHRARSSGPCGGRF
jgi:hypothetical protein